MKKELQDKLFEKYPRIFKQKDLSSQETVMCLGITCGDGWYDIIDTLCEAIQQRVQFINNNKISIKPSEFISVAVLGLIPNMHNGFLPFSPNRNLAELFELFLYIVFK